MTWPFMVQKVERPSPAVLCAACERAEASQAPLSPLCYDCGERLAGFGVPSEERQSPCTPNNQNDR